MIALLFIIYFIHYFHFSLLLLLTAVVIKDCASGKSHTLQHQGLQVTVLPGLILPSWDGARALPVFGRI